MTKLRKLKKTKKKKKSRLSPLRSNRKLQDTCLGRRSLPLNLSKHKHHRYPLLPTALPARNRVVSSERERERKGDRHVRNCCISSTWPLQSHKLGWCDPMLSLPTSNPWLATPAVSWKRESIPYLDCVDCWHLSLFEEQKVEVAIRVLQWGTRQGHVTWGTSKRATATTAKPMNPREE